jgi:putative redox protein
MIFFVSRAERQRLTHIERAFFINSFAMTCCPGCDQPDVRVIWRSWWDRFAGMADDNLRSVSLRRTSLGRYEVRNVRGGTITVGGDGADFTPVELLLAALGACTGADVDYITSKRAEPDSFDVRVTGDKIRDEAGGNRLVNLAIEFGVTFPEGAAGDAAREALPRAAKMSHDRLCTVSRTVELGTPVDTHIAPPQA